MNPSEGSSHADVYAGDTVSPREVGAPDGAIHVFNIEADAEPGSFARIANVLSIANVAPIRGSLESRRNDGTLVIYIELRVCHSTAQAIQRKLTQLTEVIHVDISLLSPTVPNAERSGA